MTFRRKLFKLLATPRGGGGGGGGDGHGGGLGEGDVDFVIELIERQNEIDKMLTEAEKEREEEAHGHASTEGGGKRGGAGVPKNPCAHLRAQLGHALSEGNYPLAESVSRTYMRCLAQKRVQPK